MKKLRTLPTHADEALGRKEIDGWTPIFWYLPQGSATYRVIYVDLSVKDISPEMYPQ